MKNKPKLLFFVTEDWYFCSHRLSLAKQALAAGFDVAVVTNVKKHGAIIEHAGIKLIPLTIKRSSINPWAELKIIGQLINIYKNEKPDLLHHVALKPVIYGSFAAKISGINNVVNALTGLGFVFSSSSVKAKILRLMVKHALKATFYMHHRMQLILQNQDDYHLLQEQGILKAKSDNIHIIRGSGVELNDFFVMPEVTGTPTVVLAARMLWDKGVGEFVAAAQLLKANKIAVKMVLVGDVDDQNPRTINRIQLKQWDEQGIIEWWGHQDNMQDIFRQSHIVCLPSYREGVPKVLLEAAACGRPLITTDAPGCREVVENNVNGKLIPIKDPKALADAITQLATDKKLREQYGKNSRKLVVEHFSEPRIIQETMQIYLNLLKK